MPGAARAVADPRGRRITDEAKLKSVEEARKAEMEVAQEEDAPPEEGPEAAAGLRLIPPRVRPPARPWPHPWGHGVVASLRAPVTM